MNKPTTIVASFNYAELTCLLHANRISWSSEDDHISDVLYFEIMDIESRRQKCEFTSEQLASFSRLADVLTAKHTVPTRSVRHVWGETPRAARRWIDSIV